jgi:hypothetical protein
MSFILKQNRNVILSTKSWSPESYSKFTNTSYPAQVDNTYIWEQDGYWLGWEDDPVVEIPPKTQQEIEQENELNRLSAYREESDPLFFKWQRGEATEQEWLDKVAEIKQRWS